MPHGRRSALQLDADRLANAVLAAMGRAVADARRRRRLTQAQLAARVETSRSTVSRIEIGSGHGVPVELWVRLAAAVGLPARFELGRDPLEEPADAGHLGIQELLLASGRQAGYGGTFELPLPRSDPSRFVDVLLRSDTSRRLIVAEGHNLIGNVGAEIRSFERKLVLTRDLAVVLGEGREPYATYGVWVVRSTRRNRELVSRYPHLFDTRFPGSSRAWVHALTSGSPPPREGGLVWCDLHATRLFEWREQGRAGRDDRQVVKSRRSTV